MGVGLVLRLVGWSLIAVAVARGIAGYYALMAAPGYLRVILSALAPSDLDPAFLAGGLACLATAAWSKGFPSWTAQKLAPTPVMQAMPGVLTATPERNAPIALPKDRAPDQQPASPKAFEATSPEQNGVARLPLLPNTPCATEAPAVLLVPWSRTFAHKVATPVANLEGFLADFVAGTHGPGNRLTTRSFWIKPLTMHEIITQDLAATIAILDGFASRLSDLTVLQAAGQARRRMAPAHARELGHLLDVACPRSLVQPVREFGATIRKLVGKTPELDVSAYATLSGAHEQLLLAVREKKAEIDATRARIERAIRDLTTASQ